MSRAGHYLRALRAFSLPLSILPVLIATAAIAPVGRWHWGALLAAAATAALLHLCGNLLNDYFDFRRGVDRRTEADEGRPGRELVRGRLSPREVLAEALVCGVLACIPAAYLLWLRGPWLLAPGAVGVVGLYAYTGPPLELKYRAAGEALVFLVFGPALMLGAAMAQTGRLEWAAAGLSVPVGMATAAVLVANNLRDRQEDRAAGIRTLAHVAGGRLSQWLFAGLVVGSALLPAAAAALGNGPLWLAAAPLALVAAVGPMQAVLGGQRKPDIDTRVAAYATVLMLILLAAHLLPAVRR